MTLSALADALGQSDFVREFHGQLADGRLVAATMPGGHVGDTFFSGRVGIHLLPFSIANLGVPGTQDR